MADRWVKIEGQWNQETGEIFFDAPADGIWLPGSTKFIAASGAEKETVSNEDALEGLCRVVRRVVRDAINETYRSDRMRQMIETRMELARVRGMSEGVALVAPAIDELERQVRRLRGEADETPASN